ncbi:RNase P and RNase MRP subunit [Neonectria magnoliae]|uniref:RNase P and RNase MRP subunit n=1 Tax=Neonectria magnoliae TaxID=2732573 RepID=A0ABR1HUY7_9HYPO
MATTSPPSRKRTVHQLDTPFSTVSWPSVSPEDQDTILELLCELLSPLGQHRQTYTKRSKGKRAAKREKAAKMSQDPNKEPPVPPMPEINAKIDVGLNSITKNLGPLGGNSDRQYSMVFVARGNQASSFNCHFPQMVGATSKRLDAEKKIRLVGFSKPCADRLSTCLGLPRVSSVAITSDAPGADALQEFVQKTVAPVDAAWLDETQDPNYLATIITASETTIGPKRLRN